MNLIKEHLDHHIHNLGDKSMVAINSILVSGAALTFSDVLDLGTKIAVFIITVIVGLLSMRHYQLKNKLKQKEIELKDQELYKLIAENKKRSNGQDK